MVVKKLPQLTSLVLKLAKWKATSDNLITYLSGSLESLVNLRSLTLNFSKAGSVLDDALYD
jgi:hypothetical protein